MRRVISILSILFIITACSDEPLFHINDSSEIDLKEQGIYVLCEGLFNQNNSSLAYYDYNTKAKNIFYSTNGRKLGDTANDILLYGSKLYIAVSVSDYIEVINSTNGKSIKMIPFGNDNHSSQPRAIAAHQDKIYVCCYDGTVCRIDTTTLTIEKRIEVGRNPDGIVATDGKLYISNSGGLDFNNPDNSISIIDIASFTETGRIEVHPNPGSIVADENGQLFVLSRGKYNHNSNSYNPILQQIDTESNTIVRTIQTDANNLATDGKNLYLYGQSENNIAVIECATGRLFNQNFIMDNTKPERIYGIDINPINGDVYICDAIDYVTPGNIYCFDKYGYRKFTIRNVGINPNSVVFTAIVKSDTTSINIPKQQTPSKVLSYKPAPGQFVNEMPKYETGNTEQDMCAKCLEKLSSTESGQITLGGFGGSITVAFSPAIENKADEYDFQIIGNAFNGSAEPGIIRVSADINNNGIADDEWYEIAGSEHLAGNITKDYTITYLRPDTPTSPVSWVGTDGSSGTMEREDQYHSQPYYPLWIDKDSIVVTSTLIHHTLEYVNGQWKSFPKEWGYADNQPNNSEKSKIKIEWAINNEGTPVHLQQVDFIQITTAVHNQAELIGELSTEITSIIAL